MKSNEDIVRFGFPFHSIAKTKPTDLATNPSLLEKTVNYVGGNPET